MRDFNLPKSRVILVVAIIAIIVVIWRSRTSSEGFLDLATGCQGCPLIRTTGTYPPESQPHVNWHPDSAQHLNFLAQTFGTPRVFDPQRHGYAYWPREDLLVHNVCWDSLELQDLPSNPLKITYNLPKKFIVENQKRGLIQDQGLPCGAEEKVRYLGAPMMYKQGRLMAEGDSLKEVVALLTLGKRLLLGQWTLQQAQNVYQHLKTSELWAPNATLKSNVELCSLGLPLANCLGELPSSSIVTLRPGGLPKPVNNMSPDGVTCITANSKAIYNDI